MWKNTCLKICYIEIMIKMIHTFPHNPSGLFPTNISALDQIGNIALNPSHLECH